LEPSAQHGPTRERRRDVTPKEKAARTSAPPATSLLQRFIGQKSTAQTPSTPPASAPREVPAVLPQQEAANANNKKTRQKAKGNRPKANKLRKKPARAKKAAAKKGKPSRKKR
jgi:hypothetical protein